MSRPASLTGTRIQNGVWQGILTASGPASEPVLQVSLQGVDLPGISVTPLPVSGEGAAQWAVQLPIPAEVLNDGVQTFLIQDAGRDPAGGDQVLAHFTIVAGVALEEDLRAEIDLLRAELDLLKRAFRRHCAETGL